MQQQLSRASHYSHFATEWRHQVKNKGVQARFRGRTKQF